MIPRSSEPPEASKVQLRFLVDLLDRERLRIFDENVFIYATEPFTVDSRGECLWGDTQQREQNGDWFYGLTEFCSVREAEEYLDICGDDPECVIEALGDANSDTEEESTAVRADD